MAHEAVTPAFLDLLDEGSECRRVASGFEFTEGPVWNPQEGYLLFSDIPAATRWRFMSGDFQAVSKETNKGNGMTYDRDLNLLVCEHASSSVARFTNGKREVLASRFEGRQLNSPNDIVVSRDGSIWFTDPTYGRMPVYGIERDTELGFQGVYRIPPGGGSLELVVEKDLFTQPNGLCFSPDETKLYINDTEQANIRVYDVNGAKLKNMRIFASGINDASNPGAPDGMKCDGAGNIWCTGPGGIWVYDQAGELIGKIAVPEFVANLHWGEKDWKTLFITASTSIYCLPVKVGPHAECYMQEFI